VLELHLLLASAALLSAILSIELKDMFKAILSFMVLNVLLAAILYVVGAPYLAVFQLLIYAGAVSILLLATVHAGEEKGE